MTDWGIRLAAEKQGLEDRTVTRLRSLIREGQIAPGEQLPSEPELARILGISRPTLRSAISELVADQLLVRRRGVGTFVASSPPALSHGFEHLRGSAESIELNGQAAGTTDLEVRHESATPELAECLGAEEGAAVVRITRTRTADGAPVMYAEEWIPEDLLPERTSLDDFGFDDSLYARLADVQLTVRRVVARFVPTLADDDLAKRLDTAVGTPVLLLEQRHYSDSETDRVVMFSNNYHNTQRIDLHTVRRG